MARAVDILLPLVGVTVGALLAAFLTRRNEKRSTGERLLIEAINDALAAIAAVANGDQAAQAEYASAMSRIAFHAPVPVVRAFRAFQDDATTGTEDGRERLIAAITTARHSLRSDKVDSADLAVLVFGPAPKGIDRDPSDSFG